MSSVVTAPAPDEGNPPTITPADFARLREEMLRALQADPAVGPIPFDRFRAEIEALYRPPMRSRNTFAKMRQVLGILADLRVESTADLTTALVARFIASRPAAESPNTTYTLVTYLRAACNWAAAEGYLRASPFAARRQWVRRVSPKPKRVHSREEIARVLALMERDVRRKTGWAQWRARRLHALAATVAYTGLRRDEALHLRVEDVHLEEGLILIVSRRKRLTKTEASAQPVPMPAALVEVLRGWLPHLAAPDVPIVGYNAPVPAMNPEGTMDLGWLFPNAYRTGPWTGGSPGRKPLARMKALGRRAGVEGFTFLSLRHSWGTHAEYWGLSELQIQRILRHTNTRTQHHYRHAEANNLREIARGIGFGNELADVEADAGRGRSAPPAPASIPAAAPAPSPASPAGPRNNGPKLDDADVAEMIELRGRGWTLKALQARYHVSRSTIHYALNGVTHKGAAARAREGDA